MFCPFCTHEETKVVDSRLVANGSQIKSCLLYTSDAADDP